MFFCMIISYKCDFHFGSQILNLMNIKKQPNGQKIVFYFVALLEWIMFSLKFLYHIWSNQMHLVNIANLHRCKHCSFMKQN
jgi:hypothetical protein